jgi:hypothetical protein
LGEEFPRRLKVHLEIYSYHHSTAQKKIAAHVALSKKVMPAAVHKPFEVSDRLQKVSGSKTPTRCRRRSIRR